MTKKRLIALESKATHIQYLDGNCEKLFKSGARDINKDLLSHSSSTEIWTKELPCIEEYEDGYFTVNDALKMRYVTITPVVLKE